MSSNEPSACGGTRRRCPKRMPTWGVDGRGTRSWRPTCDCEEVQDRLERRESPEQIAGRLRIDFPDEPEICVSAETIYQSLYIQAPGGLNRELTAYLRTGRSMRKPRRTRGQRRTRIPEMVMISERPADVADRAVPGPGPLGRRLDHGIEGLRHGGRNAGRAHDGFRDAAPPPRMATGPSQSKRRWSPRCSPWTSNCAGR